MSLSRSRRKHHRNWDYKRADGASYISTDGSPPDIAPNVRHSLQSKAAIRGRIQRLENRNGVQMDSRREPRAKAEACLRWSRVGARAVWPASVPILEVRACKGAQALGRFRLWVR